MGSISRGEELVPQVLIPQEVQGPDVGETPKASPGKGPALSKQPFSSQGKHSKSAPLGSKASCKSSLPFCHVQALGEDVLVLIAGP